MNASLEVMVKNGRLRLRGALVPVEMAIFEGYLATSRHDPILNPPVEPYRSTPTGYHTTEISTYVRPQNLCSYRVSLDKLTAPNMERSHTQAFCWLKGRCDWKCCSWNQVEETAGYYCFKLFSWEIGGPRTELLTWFIVLRPSVRNPAECERVGVGRDVPHVRNENYADDGLFEAATTADIIII
ncbi:uncharacterized protein F4822DRAFT_202386 [Hypoxylon trugodes]|uniref:uncharacterized protein n=1 Tax=Hypoxylon trugodes TaxID=326681 RepID=UPI00218CA409|nr:uncharacterized protein F4822DRAFT_202386 [Hypoxylon trugodes]KAI1389487.1 hypothetical protein F4822DRAFT_202386 [Hypoxylon trugodes]